MVNRLQDRLHMAYLISCYPAVSHTFILREIQTLRRSGVSISVASINPSDIVEDERTQEIRQEIKDTYYVKQTPFFSMLYICACSCLGFPLGMIKGVFYALFLAGWNIERAIYHLFYFIEAILVGAWMDRNHLTHLHVHFGTPGSTVALILSRIRPITYSLSIHGPDEFYDLTRYNLEEKILHARFIFCISWYTKSQLMRLSDSNFWHKMHVVPLGVDPHVFARKSLHTGTTQHVLCVSRLTRTKGLDLLLMAVEMLSRKRSDFELTIIGDGPERKHLEECIEKKGLQKFVTLTGALNQDKVLQHYQESSLFVLPSFAEGLPVVLMEALAMEIPCVASGINGIPELIKHETTGLIVYPGNVDALHFAIEKLMDSQELRQKLGRHGRERVLEDYNLKKNIARQEELLKHYLFCP